MSIRHSNLGGAIAMFALTAVAHASGLIVEGEIESESGFRFGDGSLLTSAATQFEQYANTIVVAESGGDFNNIQDAIDSITDASLTNKYLVWIAPGGYSGNIVLKPNVDLKGAGPAVVELSVSSGGTVVQMGDNSELSSLSLSCSDVAGASGFCIGLTVENAPNGVLVHDVKISAQAIVDGGSAEGIRVVPGAATESHVELRNLVVDVRASRSSALNSTASTTVTIFDSDLRASDGDTVNDAVRVRAGGKLDAHNTTIRSSTRWTTSRAVYINSGGVGTFRNSYIEARGGNCVVVETQDAATVSIESSEVNAWSCTNYGWGILAQGDGSDLKVDVAYSEIWARDYTVFNPLNPSNVTFRFTDFYGGPALGNITCLFATDEANDLALDSTCP